MVDIGGRRLHLNETGQGSPAVVLEAGLAATSLSWRLVEAEVSRFTRVVSYDRAGLGWSDAAPGPLTLGGLVDDLRALLTAARLPPPYILVGHSFGGLVVRSFALRYPREVTGLVLVDGLRPEEWYPLSGEQRERLARGVRLSRRGAFLARMGVVGWCLRSVLRGSRWLPKVVGGAASGRGLGVMKRLAGEVAKLPRDVWPIVVEHWSQPKCFLGMAAHLEALPDCAQEMCGVPLPEGIPVIALRPGEKGGHWIHLDQPELVVSAIRSICV